MKKLETMTDWLSVGTDIKIRELRQYLDTLRTQLDSMAIDFDRKIEAEAQQIDDEQERDEFYEWNSDEYWNYKETFPRILFNSFHISACTLMESELYAIARRLGKKQKQIFDVTDFKGNDYLSTASFYIKKLTSIDIKTYAAWQKVEDGRTMRNNIVHSNGILNKQHEIDVAKRYNVLNETNIDVTSGRSIKNLSINYEYSKSFISTIVEFFHALYKDIKIGDYL